MKQNKTQQQAYTFNDTNLSASTFYKGSLLIHHHHHHHLFCSKHNKKARKIDSTDEQDNKVLSCTLTAAQNSTK